LAASDYDQAIPLIDDALAEVSGYEFRALMCLISFDLAEVLARRAAAGDGERAAQLLGQAREQAVEVGAGGLIERIDALITSRD
jgi:hypothetical protein